MCDPLMPIIYAATKDSPVEVTHGDLMVIALQVTRKIMQKNHDYGDAWQKQGMPGVMSKLADKLYRVDNLLGKEALVVGEGIEDSLVDAIGYSLLGLLYLRRKEHEEAE